MTNSEQTDQPEQTYYERQMQAVEKGEVLGVLTGQVPVSGPFGARLPKRELDGEFLPDGTCPSSCAATHPGREHDERDDG